MTETFLCYVPVGRGWLEPAAPAAATARQEDTR